MGKSFPFFRVSVGTLAILCRHVYFADTRTLLYNFLSSLPTRTNRDVVWGGCVCLGKIESRWWLLMDGGGRWVVCWDVSKERGRVLQRCSLAGTARNPEGSS